MKKIILSLAALLSLSGCSTADLIEIDGNRYFKVFQTLEEGALANRCESAVGERCFGIVVFLPNDVDPVMYDGKILRIEKPEIVDRYVYTTVQGVTKTVPVIVNTKE